jgi:predicted metal-dependent hydrolase
MAKTPNWALELVEQVKAEYRSTKPLTINWRRTHTRKGLISYNEMTMQTIKRKPMLSSGFCSYSGKISITAGEIRKDQKLVLLHEIAHWLLPKEVHHGKAFWDLAFELYRKYKVPMYYALNRERDYRKEAAFAYRRNRLANNKNK